MSRNYTLFLRTFGRPNKYGGTPKITSELLATSLMSPWPVKIRCHVWQKEPPDERYGDTMDMANNSFWTSKGELQELQLLLKKDPNFENSTDWPMVVEWCSSCAISRVQAACSPAHAL